MIIAEIKRAVVEWTYGTPLHEFAVEHGRIWAGLESLHYLGLALLFGTIAVYDLRVLGLAKAAPPAALHKLVPFGIAGFAINAATGSFFFFSAPEQYVYNAAFMGKLVCLVVAGLNVALFYSWAYAGVRELGPGADAPWRAKVAAGVSLLAWTGVMVAGRLLTFYRP